MILYRNTGKPISPRVERANRTLKVSIEEMPQRPHFKDRNAKERRKFIKTIETIVRSSREYKLYLKFIKQHFDMDHCEVLSNVVNGNGKKYTIEIHHEPFQLSWITDIVLTKRQDLNESLDPYMIADEIMDLHYKGWIGLIPLCKTVHELVHSDRIAIPLQLVYQRYDIFADEYSPWIPDYVEEMCKLKALLSSQVGKVTSDVLLDPVVTYIEVEGFEYPAVPDEWKDALARQREIESPKEPTEEEMNGGIE